LTNYDTGESYRNLYAKANGDTIEYGTDTDKEDSISDRMNGKAFALSRESREIFVKDFLKSMYRKNMIAITKF
jgi:hypothetical protein